MSSYIYERKKIFTIDNYKNDKLDGLRVLLWPNHPSIVVEHYKNGKKHGSFKKWHYDGHLITEEYYHEGATHGRYRTFSDGGKARIFGRYKNDRKIGEWQIYDLYTGQLSKVCQYTYKRKNEETETCERVPPGTPAPDLDP